MAKDPLPRDTSGGKAILNAEPDSVTNTDPDKHYDDDFDYLKPRVEGDGDSNKDTPVAILDEKGQPVLDKDGKPTYQTATKTSDGQTVQTKPKDGSSESVKPLPEQIKVLEERYSNLQSVKDTEISNLKNTIATHEAKIKEYENLKIATEEFKKEPFAFALKYLPPEVTAKLDKRQYVLDQLKKEFGEDFEFNATESYTPGTNSYKFVSRERELQDALSREERLRYEEEGRGRLESEARLNESKKRVMDRFKLSEEDFQKKVADAAKNMRVDYDAIATIVFQDEIVKKAVSDALEAEKKGRAPGPGGPESVAGIQGEEHNEEPSHIKELQDAFGDF
jgi:hypothetical protein